MSTDLLEHFNNIEVKDWDLYHHNIGLKPTSKYKFGFITKYEVRNYKIYDSFGNLLSTIQTGDSIIQGIYPIPSRGLILFHTSSSGSIHYFETFNVKTGVRVGVYSKTMMSGGISYGASADVFDNGDIVVLDNANGNLTIFDYNMTVKQTVLAIVPAPAGSTTAYKVMVNSKRKLIAVLNLKTTETRIYNKSEIGAKTVRVTISGTGQWASGFTQKGNLIESPTNQTRIHRIDYINNVLVTTQSVNTNLTNYGVGFIRSIKDKIYDIQSYNGDHNLLEIDEDDGTIISSQMPLINNLLLFHDLDDEFIYMSDNTNYKVFKRSDLSLVLTITSAYDGKKMWSTKGKYENFGKYW